MVQIVVILSTITVLCLIEEWFMFWLVILFNHCCFRLYRGVVHVVVILFIIIRFDRGMAGNVVVMLSTITV